MLSFTQQFLRRSYRECFLLCLTVLVVLVSSVDAAAAASSNEDDYGSSSHDDEMKEEKLTFRNLRERMKNSKMWILRDIHPSLPLSPITLFTIVLVALQFFLNYGTYAWCEASHILIRGIDPGTKNEMLEWKKDIGTSYEKFSDYASKYSACPSATKGGKLGRFYRGDMAKNFDRACFDSNVPVGTCVGPFQTSFGWHVIYIHARDI